jgi:hypothetical protein
MKRIIAALVLGVFVSSAQAATEYLRFVGSVELFYEENNENYVAELGFSANQDLFFDFAIDTTLEAPGYPDSDLQNNFWVEYLDGSYTATGVSFGWTFQFPEGILTGLVLDDSGVNAWVGPAWQSNNGWDLSIDQWEEGQWMYLLGNCDESDCAVGDLQLIYRGSTLPPAIVPIPATFWLFGSALGLLGWVRRRKR